MKEMPRNKRIINRIVTVMEWVTFTPIVIVFIVIISPVILAHTLGEWLSEPQTDTFGAIYIKNIKSLKP